MDHIIRDGREIKRQPLRALLSIGGAHVANRKN